VPRHRIGFKGVWHLLLNTARALLKFFAGDLLDSPEASMRFHKRPRFSLAPRNSMAGKQLIPLSIIHTILSSKKPQMSQEFSNNINSLNPTVNNLTVIDDRSNILTWLSPLDPKLRHHDIRDRRVEDLGEWVLQTEEFRKWHASGGEDESANAVLFCYGDPGVGKTF